MKLIVLLITTLIFSCTGAGALPDDAAQPDASYPDAAQPDASYPDAAQPDASYPDAAQPDASYPSLTYHGQDLQTAIDEALAYNKWLDLGDAEWDFRLPVIANGNLKMRNGKLVYKGPWSYDRETVAFQINGTPTIVDFELFRTGGLNLVGMDIYDAGRGSLTRCNFYRWRNGGNVGLRFTGGQIMHSYNLKFWENDTHLVIRKGRTVPTDLKFFGAAFSTSIGTNNVPSIDISDAAHIAFYGASIENARKGNLVRLNNSKYTKFDSTRFEGVSKYAPGYSHIHLMGGTLLTSIVESTFNNTYPTAAGVYPPLVSDDGTSSYTSLRGCQLPATSPTHTPGADVTDSGSVNFGGDRLAVLRRMLEQ